MLNLYYISISGNTHAFVQKLLAYAEQAHAKDATQPLLNAVAYDENGDTDIMDHPYFAMVPTYLDGGDGITNGVRESMTVDFGDELASGPKQHLLGIIGSGNRNFNAQFGLTAKHYARRFDTPVIGLFELRGNAEEVVAIYQSMVKFRADYEEHGVKRHLSSRT